jgi:isopenicillin N synthase-like dioxygenase
MPQEQTSLPIIDVSSLLVANANENSLRETAAQIHQACRDWGFFYVKNHGVPIQLQEQLVQLSREFFAQPVEHKMQIAMSKGGRAWRGYFPVGNELTSGKPDGKEGLYFGTEIDDPSHPKVSSNVPLHGRNQFPSNGNDETSFRHVVLTYMAAIENLGRVIMSGLARSLNLEANFFDKNYFLNQPTCLFRIFNYPASFCQQEGNENLWGVGEHTDYGMLTILLQDDIGGLQVRTSQNEWTQAPPIPNTFVCNIGDMLDRMTGGYYRSTPHRVRNLSTTRDRLSFPFFLDPNWDAEVLPVPMQGVTTVDDDAESRWDKASVHSFCGTYGQYLLKKVSRAFPDLAQEQTIAIASNAS